MYVSREQVLARTVKTKLRTYESRKKLGDASMVLNAFADAKGLTSVNEFSLNCNWSAVHPVRVSCTRGKS
jgi:hypothetical protein